MAIIRLIVLIFHYVTSFSYVTELWCGDLNISLCYGLSIVSIGEQRVNGIKTICCSGDAGSFCQGKVSSWGSLGVVLLTWYVGPTVGGWSRISPTCVWSRVYYRVPDSALTRYNLHLWPLGVNVYQMLTHSGELLRHENLINFELPYKSNNDREHDIS